MKKWLSNAACTPLVRCSTTEVIRALDVTAGQQLVALKKTRDNDPLSASE
jgi:hypothetical protein